MARRRKEDSRVGLASRGIVQRLGRVSSRVDHRVVPDRGVGPDRCNASGSAMDACSDTTAWARRAECAADGGVVDVPRALSVSPRAPRIHAQRGARCDPYNTTQLLTTAEVTPRDTVGLKETKQPPAQAGGLVIWTESPDTGPRPVVSPPCESWPRDSARSAVPETPRTTCESGVL